MAVLPFHTAATCDHASDRGVVGNRLFGDLGHQATARVDHRRPISKPRPRHLEGEGLGHLANQDVIAVRRGIGHVVEARLPDETRAPAIRIHQRQLGRGQPRKQVGVRLVLQQVLIGPHRCLIARGFLGHRPDRDPGALRHRSAIRVDHVDQQAFAIRHPAEGGEDGIEALIDNLACATSADIEYPERDLVIAGDRESNLRPVRRPADIGNAGIIRQAHIAHLLAVEVHDGQADHRTRAMAPIGRCIQTHSGKTLHRARHFRNRRQSLAMHQQDRVTRRGQRRERRRRRIDNVDDLLRRQTVGVLGQCLTHHHKSDDRSHDGPDQKTCLEHEALPKLIWARG